VLDDISDHGKRDVTITDLWLDLHRLGLGALQIEEMLKETGFKIKEMPSEMSSLTVKVVQANASLLEEWIERTQLRKKKEELLKKEKEHLELRKEGLEPLRHVPRWHYKVVLDMLNIVSKHGKKDVIFAEFKAKLDWILKLDYFELIEMLWEMGFRIKKGLIAIDIIEANAPLLKEWRSKKRKWCK
jgi:hypothetical protein